MTRISPSYRDKNVGHCPLGLICRGRPGSPERGSPRGNCRGSRALGSEGMIPSTGSCRSLVSCGRVKPPSRMPCRWTPPRGSPVKRPSAGNTVPSSVVRVLRGSTCGAVFKKSVGDSTGICPYTTTLKRVQVWYIHVYIFRQCCDGMHGYPYIRWVHVAFPLMIYIRVQWGANMTKY